MLWRSTDIENTLSFVEQFGRHPGPIPPSTVVSTTLKGLSVDEIAASGPSFLTIQPLHLNALSLSNDRHDMEWATSTLSRNGPDGPACYWDPREFARHLVPSEIRSEVDTVEYVEKAFLLRCVSAAVCLFNNSLGQPPEEFPGCTEVKNLSTVGASGRADRSVFRHGQHCVQLEGKTQRAESCGPLDHNSVLFLVAQEWLSSGVHPMDPVGSPTRPHGDINWYPLAWQQKAQKILFQVFSSSLRRDTSLLVYR
jgi:hypothetical protein